VTKIERIRQTAPRYADLLEKCAELTTLHAEVIAEIAPLSEQERRRNISWVSSAPKLQPKPVVRHAGAAAILGDLLPPQPAEELNPPAPRPSWPGADRLRALGEESEAITEALRLLAPELAKAKREYSDLVMQRRGAKYQTHVEAVVDAARVLGNSIVQHHRFVHELRQDSLATSVFKPISLEKYGNISEPGSPLLRTILDAVENGHVGAGKIPTWEMSADIAHFTN
jgi:stress-induced morphogen